MAIALSSGNEILGKLIALGAIALIAYLIYTKSKVDSGIIDKVKGWIGK